MSILVVVVVRFVAVCIIAGVSSAQSDGSDEAHRHHHHRHRRHLRPCCRHDRKARDCTVVEFPSVDLTMDMAALSWLVYIFVGEKDDTVACDKINHPDNYESWWKEQILPQILRDKIQNGKIMCHWYYHDRKDYGTQVLALSTADTAKGQNDNDRYDLAIAFAGTDDLKTALVDVDIRTKQFGDGTNGTALVPNDTGIRMHSGFNDALFQTQAYQKISALIQESVRNQQQDLERPFRVLTTGHSLGGALSILTTVGLTVLHSESNREKAEDRGPVSIQSITFGCPQVGNKPWRDFVSTYSIDLGTRDIWRFVLGWDLVARLPEFLCHVGHTVELQYGNDMYMQGESLPHTQKSSSLHRSSDFTLKSFSEMSLTSRKLVGNWTTKKGLRKSSSSSSSTGNGISSNNATASAYYQHYGNTSLGYASVPTGWSATPYLWIPGALESHHIIRYWNALDSINDDRKKWIDDFVHRQHK